MASTNDAPPNDPPDEAPPVRVGIVGLGRRGRKLTQACLSVPGMAVTALAGSTDDSVGAAVDLVIQERRPRPVGLTGRDAYRTLVERDDVDLVLVATPFDTHVPVMLAAMEAGALVATEVPAATTVEDGWALVEASERTGVACTLLENFLYRREVLTVLTMVQRGALGILSHCEVGYQHDTRALAIRPDGTLGWGAADALHHDGNRYPTHPFGPAAAWTGVNHGDRLDFLVSMSSRSRGFNALAADLLGADHPLATRAFARGDVNTTLIRTREGITITLYYDCQTPRPRDPIFRLQGTRGIHSGTLGSVHLAGRSPTETWEPMTLYQEEFEHPLWARRGEEGLATGLGAPNHLMLLDLADAVRRRRPFTIDVRNAVTWSVLTELSERSVRDRSRPVDVPDFTSGRWRDRPPLDIPVV